MKTRAMKFPDPLLAQSAPHPTSNLLEEVGREFQAKVGVDPHLSWLRVLSARVFDFESSRAPSLEVCMESRGAFVVTKLRPRTRDRKLRIEVHVSGVLRNCGLDSVDSKAPASEIADRMLRTTRRAVKTAGAP